MTYEECRLEYFKEQYAHAERRLRYWVDAMRTGRHGYRQIEYEDKCSECGAIMNYYADVIKMMGGNVDEYESHQKPVRKDEKEG